MSAAGPRGKNKVLKCGVQDVNGPAAAALRVIWPGAQSGNRVFVDEKLTVWRDEGMEL